MDKAKKAAKQIADGKMNCAQAVLTTYCTELGLPKNIALRLAGGFGGGMGHCDNTCGAVCGAVMVIGLRPYPGTKDSRERLQKTYFTVREFNKKFTRKNGSVRCTDLVGYDLSKPKALNAARSKNVFSTVCPKFVEDAVSILENL